MYPNPYFLEKTMEQHNKNLERKAMKGWWSSRKTQAQEKQQPQGKGSPAAHSGPGCTGKDGSVCCQAYTPCQA